MTTTAATTAQANAAEKLRKFMTAGTKVWASIQHVSQSGMTKWVRLSIVKDDNIIDITYAAAHIIGTGYSLKYGGLKMSGAGVGMGFYAVYLLSLELHGDGDALKHQKF
jgi:hypothetical protein